MKKLFFIVVLIATVFLQQVFARNTAKTEPSQLLNSYLSLQDAVVGGNVNAVAASASAFVNTLNETDKEIVTDENRNALLSDAVGISQAKDLKIQREKFTTLSNNLFVLDKTGNLSTEPFYQQYCPMKKASWLSNSKAIKNPYYGSAMLTCGSLKETL